MGNRAITALVTLWTALLFSPASALAAKVFTPVDKTLVREGSVAVLGSAPGGTEVAWSVRGAARKEAGVARVDFGELFEVFVLLEPGLNVVTVGGETLEIFYATGSAPVPKGFSVQRLHAGNISRCEDCHDLVTMKLRDGGFPEACLGCHTVESQNPKNPVDPRRDMHFQTAISDCGSCHVPHVSKDAKLLRQDASSLCGRCHVPQVPGTQSHPAYQEGGCAACHDAHFSGFPKGLKEAEAGVCNRCHEQGARIEVPKQHSGLTQEASCGLCHNPHGSSSKLLRAKESDVCGSCHPKVLSGGHKGELSACHTCHDPHLARGGGLLRGTVAGACGECHEKVAEGKTVHAAVKNGCQKCHAPHRDTNLSGAKSSCLKCHDLAKSRELAGLHGGLSLAVETCARCHPAHASRQDKLVRAKLHNPLTQGKCSVCHGGGEDRSLVVTNPAARCRLCHTFETEAAARGNKLHEPVASGGCTKCHDPHMSDAKGLLLVPGADLCRKCHTNATPAAGRALHPAAETCTDCHRPHDGPTAKLLSAAVPDLCFRCHDDPRKSGGAVHPALDDGCLACHDPHTGYAPGFLKKEGKALCLGCHDDPAGDKSVVHGALAKGCQGCHTPHASANAKLLKTSGNALCRACHAPSKGHHPLAVPEGGDYPKAETFAKDGKEFSCVGCHAAHGSAQRKLFRRPEKELCVSCHEEM